MTSSAKPDLFFSLWKSVRHRQSDGSCRFSKEADIIPSLFNLDCPREVGDALTYIDHVSVSIQLILSPISATLFKQISRS